MHYDATDRNHGLKFDPFKALAVPRPIVAPAGLTAASTLPRSGFTFDLNQSHPSRA